MNVVDDAQPLDVPPPIPPTPIVDIQAELRKEIEIFAELSQQMQQALFTDYSHLAQRLIHLNKNAHKVFENANNNKESIAVRKSELVFCYPDIDCTIPRSDLAIFIEKKTACSSVSRVYFKVIFNSVEHTSDSFSLRYPLINQVNMKLPSLSHNVHAVSVNPLRIQFYLAGSQYSPDTLMYASFSYHVFRYLFIFLCRSEKLIQLDTLRSHLELQDTAECSVGSSTDPPLVFQISVRVCTPLETIQPAEYRFSTFIVDSVNSDVENVVQWSKELFPLLKD